MPHFAAALSAGAGQKNQELISWRKPINRTLTI
jgi:hypothetical protein